MAIDEGVCRWCGLPVDGHRIERGAEVNDSTLIGRLVGADGHLYEALYFPRKQKPVVEDDMAATDRLKSFDAARLDLDTLIEMSSDARRIQSEREQQGLVLPEWLTDAAVRIGRQIRLMAREVLEKRRRDLIAQQAGLESASEKRERIAAELSELDARLAQAPNL